MHRAALFLPLALLAGAACAQEEARLLRFPHIQGDRIAFVYGGDIWTATSQGGRAHRITSFDEGFELFPRISPDGRWIAFSGEYSGTRQIYLVPFEGGQPRQLTFYPDVGVMPPRGGFDNLPLDWTPDGKKILVRMNRTPFGERMGRYYLVDPWNGGLEQPLQIPEGGPASYSPDGRKLAYNIISREWRTWKRYQAGRAQDVWIYDLEVNTIQRVTDYPGTDDFPMWVGERIYFSSDRKADGTAGTLNLFCYEIAGGTTRQVTHFDDFDVLFPTRGKGGIIFECGGYLYVLDTPGEKLRRLSISLSDDRPWTRPVWKDGSESVQDFDVSPAARHAVVEFRGELFRAPAARGEARNISRSPARRERQPRYSPAGGRISYLAEVGLDYELFLRDLHGGKEQQLTRGSGSWILDTVWSPDGKKIALTDKKGRLRILDVKSRAIADLDHSSIMPIQGLAWSADSAWLTYVKGGENGFFSVWVCPAAKAEPHRVTSTGYADSYPVFDRDGRYLYFVSARDFSYGDLSFRSRLYALLLRAEIPSPMAPLSDEEETGESGRKDEKEASPKDESSPGKQAAAKEPLKIEFDGLEKRLVVLPGSPGSYYGLIGLEGGFLYRSGGKLMRYDTEKRKSEAILDGGFSVRLSADAKKLLYRHKGGLCLARLAPGQKAGKDPLPLGAVRVRIDRRTEWAQMYQDAWRIMRDWFYDPGMHGVDWQAIRSKYAALLPYLAHRRDLDFLLGEMVGELNCGHTYVLSGEEPRVPRVPVGVLGCELEVAKGRYRIAKIFAGESWNENTRSPLAEPGVGARVGDYLLAIDGVDLPARENPYRLLEDTVGHQVRLTLCADPGGSGAREVIVVPAASEVKLRYLDWVARNRKLVEKLSGGRIGYVHVPDTATEGHRRFYEGFRAQARVKQALIIDDRYNGGGHIPNRMIQALNSPALNFWTRRNSELYPTPGFAFDGPLAMLINGYSSSGGDAFPFYFRKRALGPLIGKKTWGGLVGYSGSPRLVDGGHLAVPAFAFINTEGRWDVEAVGVSPDIEVFDDPTLIQAGREPVLEAAVNYLLDKLEKGPANQPPPKPKGPIR